MVKKQAHCFKKYFFEESSQINVEFILGVPYMHIDLRF